MTPQQQNYLNSILGQNLGGAQGALGGLLQPFSEEFFQETIAQPTQQNYERNILPALESRYAEAGAGSSSALNQALTQSAEDLNTTLAQQRLGLFQGQQQAQMGALGQLGNALGQKAFDPITQGPQSGMLKDIIGAAGSLGGGYMAGGGDLMALFKKLLGGR